MCSANGQDPCSRSSRRRWGKTWKDGSACGKYCYYCYRVGKMREYRSMNSEVLDAKILVDSATRRPPTHACQKPARNITLPWQERVVLCDTLRVHVRLRLCDAVRLCVVVCGRFGGPVFGVLCDVCNT